MTHLVKSVCGVTLLVAALGAPAFAENANLVKAKRLYAEQKYSEAKAEFDKVIQSDLSKAERSEYDSLSMTLPKALEGSSQALRDKAAADKAYDSSNWTEARRLYQ